MAEPRDINLGGRTFTIPPLVLKHNIKVYPLCRTLTNGGLVQRAIDAGFVLDVDEDTMGALAEMIYLACLAAEPDLTREAFDGLAATPPELLDAFFAVRFQTGGWRPAPPTEDGDSAGEGKGAETPRPSTSTASSPARSATSGRRRTTGSTRS